MGICSYSDGESRMSLVGVKKSNYKNVYDDIKSAIELGGGLNLRNGDNVVIKINLCDFRQPETGAVTHPVFLDATLNYLRKNFRGLNLFVVESDATSARPDLLIKWLGFENILRKNRAKYVNLSKNGTVKKTINGRFFREMDIPRILYEPHFFISMSKLKTAMITKITCCLKNQFGCIPYWKKVKFHYRLDDAIVDANLAMKPDFCIVDGIIGMGGTKGPNDGVPLNYETIVTGKDPVAVDSTCARILGFSPFFVGHIRKAQLSSIGQMKSRIAGNALAEVKKDSEYSGIYARILRFTMGLKSNVG
jgi:uncharacterized protein (DUF362 family)